MQEKLKYVSKIYFYIHLAAPLGEVTQGDVARPLSAKERDRQKAKEVKARKVREKEEKKKEKKNGENNDSGLDLRRDVCHKTQQPRKRSR